MELRKAGLKTTVHPGKNGSFEIIVTCEKPSLWASLETRSFDTRFSDNFRPILPGQVWSVTATPSTRVSKAAFIKELTARDVYDMTMR